jgi:N-acetylneuraminic acid mutarotase
MLIYGGTYENAGETTYSAMLIRYNPAHNTWTEVDRLPPGRTRHTAVWTGSELLIWGGRDGDSRLATGIRYDPVMKRLSAISTLGAPSPRDDHTAVWTGTEMIIWGGDTGLASQPGGRYNPRTDTWRATTLTDAPDSRREDHTAVWTGTEMIVWGGYDGGVFFAYTYDDGARYDPVLDRWTALPSTNQPTRRAWHRAVWTGQVMIVWGGEPDPGYGNQHQTGAVYDPVQNTWSPMSTTGVPAGRSLFDAVWTGTEMLIWGGRPGSGSRGGARYTP